VLEELRKLGEEVDKVNERIMTVHQKAMKEKRSFDEIISLYSA
jgi:hypothetical protein